MSENHNVNRMSVQELLAEWKGSIDVNEESSTSHMAISKEMDAISSDFDNLDVEHQLEWLARVRILSPHARLNEAYRLAREDFRIFRGVLPVGDDSFSQSSTPRGQSV